MAFLRRRVHDDRGRKIDRARLRAARPGVALLELVKAFVLGVFLIGFVLPCFAGWMAVLISMAFDGQSVVGIILSLLCGVAAVLLMAAVPADMLNRFIRERQRRLLADLIKPCPACFYELDGLARESDGCTVCPECGAAWRLGRNGQ